MGGYDKNIEIWVYMFPSSSSHQNKRSGSLGAKGLWDKTGASGPWTSSYILALDPEAPSCREAAT